MSHRAKQRSVIGLLAVAGVAAAVLLAVFGMPYGKTTPEAFAHLYTHPNGNTTHLHIDADLDDGLCTAPYDATVPVGAVHEVGVCIEDYDTACTPDDGGSGNCSIESFELHIRYSGDPTVPDNINECNEMSTPSPYLDDNPDANDGSTASGDKLGGGWDCSGLGVQAPVCDDAVTANTFDAVIICNASVMAPDKDLNANPGLLATIEFTATGTGTDTIDFGVIDANNKNAVGKPRPGAGIARCGTAVPADQVGCFGADIDKVPDIGIDKSLVGQALAGGTATFAVDVTSNVAGSVTGFCDDLPNNVTFNPGLSDPSCSLAPDLMGICPVVDDINVVVCAPVVTPSTVNIVVDVPVEKAGKSEVNAVATAGDPNPANDIAILSFDVEPADVTIVKSPDRDPAVYSEGEQITWTVTATSNGPSPASSVVLSDTVGVNQSIVSASVDVGTCSETGTSAAGIVGQTATCTSDQVLAPLAEIEMTVVTDVVGSAGNLCVDDAAVQWADPLSDSVHAEATCLPPTVRMEKDIDLDATAIDNDVNLFIEKDDPFVCLDVYELVSNAGNDPDGVGAYEFQLKFDHKIFDIEIEDTSWLSNGGTRTVDCSMTIITENYILWACASYGPTPGQTSDGVAAIIHVCPEPDLYLRLTPGQENGIFRVLLDENCELADVYGDPLRIPIGDLAPGVLPGGLIEVCSDMAITVRILEGDLDLDCDVDLEDAQAIAFRYGAVFGTLYYDPWYDLEPWNKDFDIDIKDLQKVFGRLGSVCGLNGEGTIPPQPPLPMPDP